MKKHDKEILQNNLNNEKAVIKKLKAVYKQSLNDIIKKSKALQEQINNLQGYINTAVDEEEKAVFQSMQQSKIYQKQYQDALKKQISAILDTMQVEEFKTIDEYNRSGISDEELSRQLNIAKSSFICQFNNIEETTRAIMEAHFNNYNLYDSPQIFNTVTKTDINNAIKQLKREYSVL